MMLSLDEWVRSARVLSLSAMVTLLLVGCGVGSVEESREPPSPAITVMDLSVSEGDSGPTQVQIQLQLAPVATETVSVEYTSVDGSAQVADGDYQAVSGTVSFAPGESRQSITVTINGDTRFESDETFLLRLSDAVNADLSDAEAQITIVNDDAVIPTVSVSDVAVVEGDSTAVNAVFDLTLSVATSVAVTVNYATVDGSAVAGSDYTAASGSVSFVPGQTTQQVSVAVAGDYLVEGDESFSLLLSDPVNAVLGDAQGVAIISDNDVLVIPAISVGDVVVGEGDNGTVDAVFDLTLSVATSVAVTVNYATVDGSAVAGSDYTAANGTVSFAPGQTTQQVSVAVVGDTQVEGNESFSLLLANPVNATLGDAEGSATIRDDDVVIPSVNVADVGVVEGDSGTVDAVFDITLSVATSVAVTVNYATVDGSAVAGADYTAANGTVSFAPGQTTQQVSVAVVGDSVVEPDENFALVLTALSNATVGDGEGVATIANDDIQVVGISVADVALFEGDTGQQSARFLVELSVPAIDTVNVSYISVDDTATTADNDYIEARGTLTFNPGEQQQYVDVAVVGDTFVEETETFSLVLYQPLNAALVDDTAVATLWNDDVVLPIIDIADAAVVEGDSGVVNGDLVVSLSEPTSVAVSVSYVSQDGSASVADGDYTAVAGTLHFQPGETLQTITVPVGGDLQVENDETVVVALSGAVNGMIGRASATLTITDDDSASPPGLVTRPANPTCIASPRLQLNSNIQLERFTTMTFNRATVMRQAPGDNSRWFIALKAGQVRSFENSPTAAGTNLVVDIRDRVDDSEQETGLLGLAFDPDFQTNRYVYLSYTATGPNSTTPFVSTISRFTFNVDMQTIDPASEEILLTLGQPYRNHNGGSIGFGPGPGTGKYLYIGFGDGGGSGDPLGNGQNADNLFSAMLRIDVDVSAADWAAGVRYYTPPDNPFASSTGCGSGSGCPEIYAWGLRNPWSWSFDRDTQALWVGDVGQNNWEEINRVVNGGNYGWSIREGAHCFGSATCNTTGLIDPVVEYDHSGGSCSVTGGYVYRGSAIPGLRGTYLYGDFCSGRIWGIDASATNPAPQNLITTTPYSIAGFAESNGGELFLINYGSSGNIQRIVAAGGGSTPFPTKLSETGCVDPLDPSQPVTGLIPYMINAPFWSDAVEKHRYLSIPDGEYIQINNLNDWVFPIGSVLLKHFRINGALVETRLLERHDDGAWGGYSYEWNDTQTDATLVVEGKTKLIDGQSWYYPTPGECTGCHTQVGGGPLGPETAQMNREFLYPSTGINANQLQTYEHIGMFSPPLADIPANLPALADPTDTTADLNARARAYLHTNCAQCHQPGGPTSASMDLRYTTADVDMNVCNVSPSNGDLGISGAMLVAPGDPDRSILLQRMSRRDIYGMPPFGSFIPDAEGAALLRQWITAMGGSCP